MTFQGSKHDIWPYWFHQRSLEAVSCTWILPKPKKPISILTETCINHDQIHHIRNNWLGSIFFSPGYSHAKGILFVLYLGLKGITKVDTDPEGRLVSFKVNTSNESSLFFPLQGIAPENSWLGGAFLNVYKNICKIKTRDMKTK